MSAKKKLPLEGYLKNSFRFVVKTVSSLRNSITKRKKEDKGEGHKRAERPGVDNNFLARLQQLLPKYTALFPHLLLLPFVFHNNNNNNYNNNTISFKNKPWHKLRDLESIKKRTLIFIHERGTERKIIYNLPTISFIYT